MSAHREGGGQPSGDEAAQPASDDASRRLERLLGPGGAGSLRERLRRHFERGGAATRMRLAGLDADDHARLAGLIGRKPRRAGSIQFDLADIDLAMARAGLAASLREALERLDGPIIDRPAERRRIEAAWAAVCAGEDVGDSAQRLDPGRGIAQAGDRESAAASGLRRLLAEQGGVRLVRRLARQDVAMGRRIVRSAVRVIAELPARGMPRSQLAASTLGDAHGLDDGSPVAALVLAAWQWSGQAGGNLAPARPRLDQVPVPTEPGLDASPASGLDGIGGIGEGKDAEGLTAEDGSSGQASTAGLAERRREIWAGAGVLVNELARPALVLNLLQAEGRPVEPGQPTWLSLRRLVREPLLGGDLRGKVVFVCENPNLVAIVADTLGSQSAPLVCTDGMPAAAQRTLLRQLTGLGAQLRYHGDFDWPGILIANLMVAQFGAVPWRMDEADYREAVAMSASEDAPRLAGAAVLPGWSESLGQAMQELGRPIAEEAVAARLVGELRMTSA